MNQTIDPPFGKSHKQAQFQAFIESCGAQADSTNILLFFQIRKLHHQLTRSAVSQLENAGLSWHQLMLLMVLQGNEKHGTGAGMQPSELSDLQGIPRNQVSMLLADLEQAGFVSRELDGKDRRRFVICLTPRGRKTLKDNLGTQFRHITQCFAALDAQERDNLLQLLTRLTASLSDLNV